MNTSPFKKNSPALLIVPSAPTSDENRQIFAQTSGASLRGSAAMTKLGATVGLMNIAECEDSYFFHVSLPGVRRGDEFICKIREDGKVSISGVTTTGEQTVYAAVQEFRMMTNNLCSSGPFSLSFQLPGHVDINKFVGEFSDNGIFTGEVMKLK